MIRACDKSGTLNIFLETSYLVSKEEKTVPRPLNFEFEVAASKFSQPFYCHLVFFVLHIYLYHILMFFYSCIFFNPVFQRGPIIIAKFIYFIEAWKDIVCTIT
ncbi:hypothetical protein ACJX0J_038878, partial [Zea mays]